MPKEKPRWLEAASGSVAFLSFMPEFWPWGFDIHLTFELLVLTLAANVLGHLYSNSRIEANKRYMEDGTRDAAQGTR